MSAKTNSPFPGLNGPVVIGGVGGSGTRVLFQLLKELGFYLGRDLNPNGDNLWFTILFKRPACFETVSKQEPPQIRRMLQIFHKLMYRTTGSDNRENRLSIEEGALFFDAAQQYYHQLKPSSAMSRAEERMEKLTQYEEVDFSRFTGWGWKEPNSFIYLKHLSRYFKGLKFIQVIRHGLDMAFAKRNQYRFWAPLFQLDRQEGWKNSSVAFKKMEYWCAANRYAVEQGKQCLGERFMLVNFDTLCLQPEQTIRQLLAFLKIDKPESQCENLFNIPQVPPSMGRYKSEDISFFTDRHRRVLHEFGFQAEA